MDISKFKSHFSYNPKLTHLNSSGMSLIPDVYRDMVIKWTQRFYNEGAHCAMEGWTQTQTVRAQLAKFIGATSNEVSFFPTTASAISQAAFGIPLQKDDEILTWDQEYPSNFYPWRMAAQKRGAKVIQIESAPLLQTPAQKILDHVNAKTKVIAISWVQFQAGAVTDLKFLAHQLKGKDIWLVADVIQGVGVRPFHFHESGFDIVCCGSHKFLCSGYGAGFMAIKESRIPQIDPLEFGAMSFGTPETPKSFRNNLKTDSSRYEPGTKALVEILGMGETLKLFSEFGIDAIFDEASRVCKKMAMSLRDLKYDVIYSDGPILNFIPKDHCAQKLTDAGISFVKRGPGIRLSTHAYIRDEEIDRVLNVLND